MLLSDTSIYDVKKVRVIGPHVFENTSMHTVLLTKHNGDTVELTLFARSKDEPIQVSKVNVDE